MPKAKPSEQIQQPSKEAGAGKNDSRRASAGEEPGEPISFEFDAALSSAVERKRSRPVKQVEIKGPLSPQMLDKMHRYWQAANYLTVGQIYLSDNPLLQEPLRPEHIKPRLLGHWG
ncbi:MAG TPA: hypothetical protein VGS27_04860, partial [Candidatus Sulfotelmatobacter sp.]|nr:hypothetical protein [Candidatus Sulfotelmatobacter sp.]